MPKGGVKPPLHCLLPRRAIRLCGGLLRSPICHHPIGKWPLRSVPNQSGANGIHQNVPGYTIQGFFASDHMIVKSLLPESGNLQTPDTRGRSTFEVPHREKKSGTGAVANERDMKVSMSMRGRGGVKPPLQRRTKLGIEKRLLQGRQSSARGGAGYRRAGDVVVNHCRLGAAKTALARDANADRCCGDKISLISWSAAARRRNDGWSLTRIRIGVASLLTRRRRQNTVDQDGLVASCRGARNTAKRDEQRRITILPGHVVCNGCSCDAANVGRGRCLIRHHSRSHKIRYGDRGNNQNNGDNYQQLNQ